MLTAGEITNRILGRRRLYICSNFPHEVAPELTPFDDPHLSPLSNVHSRGCLLRSVATSVFGEVGIRSYGQGSLFHVLTSSRRSVRSSEKREDPCSQRSCLGATVRRQFRWSMLGLDVQEKKGSKPRDEPEATKALKERQRRIHGVSKT